MGEGNLPRFPMRKPTYETNSVVQLQTISSNWNCPVVVAATGPSLTPAVALTVRRERWPLERCRVVAVNDAYRLLPYADILYACDDRWWRANIADIDQKFHGERWTTTRGRRGQRQERVAGRRKLNLVGGHTSDTFSNDPAVVHYGSNSGFQAVNLALLKGAAKVILVGFDMRVVNGLRHFFGDHPDPLHNRADYRDFIAPFTRAAKSCRVPVVNATPDSALDCFPKSEPR